MFSDVHTIVFKTELMNTTGHTSAILWLLDIFTTNKDNQQSLDFFFFCYHFQNILISASQRRSH